MSIETIIFILLFVGGMGISYIERYLYKKKLSKKEINFDEFDDVEKVLQQEEHEKEQLLTDFDMLNQITNEAYRRASTIDTYTITSEIDTNEARRQAEREIEQAKKDIKNFRVLDSVEVEEDKIYESSTISEIKENGNNFDAELFKKWCKEIFKCIKSGTEEELKAVKYFMTEEMYDKLIFQTKQFEKDGLEFVTEGLTVMDCKLLEYGRWLEKEEIKVLVKAKMKEYIIQKNTNKILRGNNKKFYEKGIVMTFLKRNAEDKEGFMSNCPNCGAETTQTTLGRCRYCDTLVFPIRYNWTLVKFETM